MADDLTTTLRAALKKPMFFAFVANGAGSRLLADKKKIPPKETAAVKKECGGGTIFQGRCKGENGTLVFEVAKEPPGSLAALLKKIIKQDAQLSYPIEVRVVGDLADEDEAGAEPEAEGEQGGNAVVKRLNAMVPEIKTALGGPNKPRVQTLLGTVNGLINNKDFAQADKVLDELAPLVKPVPTAPPTASVDGVPPPPKDGPPTKTPPPPAATRFADRLKALAPVLQKIEATRSDEPVKQARAEITEANKAYRAKQYDEANAALDRTEALIKKALTTPPPKTPPPSESPSSADKLQADWERRVIAIEPRVLDAQKKRPGEAKWMPMFMSVQDLGSEGNFQKALEVLDRLEGLLNAAPKPVSPSLAAWQTLHQKTINKLRTLASRLAKAKHSRGKEAEIEVLSVIKQLTANPATSQQVTAVEVYLQKDRVVSDVCELAFDFRPSLLSALAELKPQLTA